ncbi:hypothetical protein KGM_213484 [Danaus plexippus plexippus]|uniref:Uncharacterized protein n=1 Tax=Danaus plexippus plexippus TaxID=278856 RepID=A0A212EJH0_DANPL|nr:hypothetical protein KGM_213484 [Danaus plexippus plexippus]
MNTLMLTTGDEQPMDGNMSFSSYKKNIVFEFPNVHPPLPHVRRASTPRLDCT